MNRRLILTLVPLAALVVAAFAWPNPPMASLPTLGAIGVKAEVPGPPRVGLQAGHWKNAELPDEFVRIREGGVGTSAAGTAEWEANLAVAQRAKLLLEARGVIVDLLPATVPPDYLADAFVSIHADGSLDTGVSGFKVASARNDRTGLGPDLDAAVTAAYAAATGLGEDGNVTRNMTGYYAFNSRRYDHAISRSTPGIIVETGFLTSPADRKVIIGAPDTAASGIAEGILAFLAKKST